MVHYQTTDDEPGTPPAHDYGLPPLPPLPCPEMRGPTPWCNWVLRGRLLAGAYPASLDDAETERILTTLLELGINTFVCLQAEFSLHTPEAAWRAGQGLRPYIKDAQRLLIRARETGSRRVLQDKLDFLHLPIIDGSVTSDVALSRLADDCCTRILRGERLYVHCWGGHGRTGTLIAVMLGRLYGITCASALRFTQAFHDSRKYPQGVRSPQTTPQVAQVKRLLPDPPSVRGVLHPRDPSIVLDAAILRPGSPAPAASAQARAPVSSPLPAQVAVPTPPAQRPSSRAAPSAAEVAAKLAETEIDDAPALPSVPVNQQRKQAIRAAKQAGSGGLAAALGGMGRAAGSALSSALQAGSLQARPAAATAGQPDEASTAAIPASPSPAEQQRDWLQSVFGKSLMRHGQPGGTVSSASGASAAVAQPPRSSSAVDTSHHLRQSGYLEQYVQQQQRLSGSAGKQGSGAPTIFLTATSGSAAADGGVSVQPADACAPLEAQRLDMRPSKITVAVPAADLAAAERSASSMQRMRNYLSGQRAN